MPRTVVLALARPLAVAGAVMVAYYVLPLEGPFGGATVGALLGGLLLIGILGVLQVRSILRAPHPTLRAVEAFAFTVPVFLLLFAAVYVVLDASRPQQFTEPLTRTDALYFVVTVLATVGFGDIAPVSQTARGLVTLQMVGNLLLLGFLIRAMTTAVQHRNRDRWADGLPARGRSLGAQGKDRTSRGDRP